MNLCVIPARGGSKRIPRKNIKEFCGRPMIAWSINAAIESSLFDEIMVSTDDEEIAVIAREYGANVPFMRSKANSDDYSGTGDVLYEVISKYEKSGLLFDTVCCLYATAPLIKKEKLSQAFKLLNESDFDVVFPIGKYSSPILRSYGIDATGKVMPNFPEYEAKRSQDLRDAYFDAGQFYWLYPGNLKRLQNKNSFGSKKGAILLEEYEIQDIDEASDWEIAEFKFRYMMSKSLLNIEK